MPPAFVSLGQWVKAVVYMAEGCGDLMIDDRTSSDVLQVARVVFIEVGDLVMGIV